MMKKCRSSETEYEKKKKYRCQSRRRRRRRSIDFNGIEYGNEEEIVLV